MNERRFTLVKRRKNRKFHKLIALLLILILLGLGIYLIIKEFSIEKIEPSDPITYSEEEVVSAIKKQHYVDNCLAMIVVNKLFEDTYLPFIDRVSMSVSLDQPHVLKVKVKEGIRAGVFQYMEKNVYFDSEGIAQESRNMLLSGVPVVTGVKFDKMVLGEKIPVDGNYFDTIIFITKKITSYNLDVSRIHFEGENHIYLVSGKYQIYLGGTRFLENKMSKISEILRSVSQKSDSGIIDMHLFTDDKDIITFRENQ